MKAGRQKEVIKMAEAEGLTVAKVTLSKSIKLEVRAVDGRVAKITAPWTPSCPHADANQRAMFRRFAQGRQK